MEAIRSGKVLHVARSVQSEKNLLATGALPSEEAVGIILATRGHQVSRQPHDQDPSIMCHILKPNVAGVSWYVKCFERRGIWFVSFHPQERGERR